MAVIWKSRGTIGSDATDAGTTLPLALIDDRLLGYKLLFRGENPRPFAPATTYFKYLIVEVTRLDEPTATFDRRGFYLVLGLDVEDADFLFEPPPSTGV